MGFDEGGLSSGYNEAAVARVGGKDAVVTDEVASRPGDQGGQVSDQVATNSDKVQGLKQDLGGAITVTRRAAGGSPKPSSG